MKYRLLTIVTLATACLLSGCVTSNVDEMIYNEPVEGIGESSVVILGRRHSSDYETEPDFVLCVGEHITSYDNSITVIGELEFINALYPWFEPRTAPLHPESDPESVCTGLGHATCAGADWPLNPFGIAFATAGFKWTETLCNEVRCAMVERGAARPPRCSPLQRGEVGGVCECDGASRARIARARRGCT